MGLPIGASAATVTTNATFCTVQTCAPPGARTAAIDNASYEIIAGAAIANGATVSIQRLGWDGVFRTILVISITSNTPYVGNLVQLCPCFGLQMVTAGLTAGTITYMDFVCTVRE
jgi:hypothetical protein